MKYIYFTLFICLMCAASMVCSPLKKLINICNNHAIVAGDSTVQLWNLSTGKSLEISRGTAGSLFWIRTTDSHIITVLDDRFVKIFDHTGRYLRTLSGNNNVIALLAATNNHVVTYSIGDDTVKVWDILTGTCLHTFQEWASSIAITSSYVIIGCWAGSCVKVYNIQSGICEKCLTGHKRPAHMIAATDNYMITGAQDYSAKIWDLKTGQCLYTMAMATPDTFLLSVAINDSFAITGFFNSIKVWNLSTGKCVHTLTDPANISSRPNFDFPTIDNNDHLIAGSTMGTIKRWSLKKGTCVKTYSLC